MNIATGNIGNALHSVAPEHVVAITNEIYDQTRSLYQDQINQQQLTESANLSRSIAERFSSQSAGSESVPVYMDGGTPKTVSRVNVASVTASFRGNLVGNVTGNVTGNLTGSAVSASLQVYAPTITGSVGRFTVASASTGFRGNLTGNVTGDLTGSRVSASVQVYAPNVSANTVSSTNANIRAITSSVVSSSNAVVTNLTASYISGTLVGTASAAISASYVPFTQLIQTKNTLTASVGGTTKHAIINTASYASVSTSASRATIAESVEVSDSSDQAKYSLVWESNDNKLHKTAASLSYYPGTSTVVNAGEVRAERFTHRRVTGATAGTVKLAAGNTTYIDTPTGNITLTLGSVGSGQEGIFHCIINMGETLYGITVPGTLAEGSALINKASCKYEISICEGITIIIRT